jgi:TetR/AcrR family transcriptional regulator
MVERSRRLGLNTSATRTALIQAAIEVIKEEGYAALTSRRVAEKLGLKQQLVHYYFRTMDDLVAAAIRESGDQVLGRIARAAASEEPLRALWELVTDLKAVLFTIEVAAMANHHSSIRAETVRYAEQTRKMTAEIIGPYLERRGISKTLAPVAVMLVMTAVGGLLTREKMFGMAVGHREIEAFIDGWLTDLAAPEQKEVSGSRQPVRKKTRRRI